MDYSIDYRGNRYRTKKETIELFKQYAYGFGCDAARTDNPEKRIEYLAKADAYEIAAFELEHNME